jgi:hypothetical protein
VSGEVFGRTLRIDGSAMDCRAPVLHLMLEKWQIVAYACAMKLHGSLIRARRLELGLTLEDVRSLTGIDKSGLSKVERGLSAGLRPHNVRHLARCLKMPMHEISPELAELKRRTAA